MASACIIISYDLTASSINIYILPARTNSLKKLTNKKIRIKKKISLKALHRRLSRTNAKKSKYKVCRLKPLFFPVTDSRQGTPTLKLVRYV